MPQLRSAERPFDAHVVFRFFHDPSHADALVAGNVWISTLESCRRFEDPKQGDPEEGFQRYNSGYSVGNSGDKELELIAAQSGIHIGPGSSNITLNNNTLVKCLGDALVLCTTELFEPSVLSETFGRYCVEISNPKRFFELVSAQLRETHEISEARFGRVIYKDRFYTGLERPPGPLGFVKPPDKYSEQHEVRFLWSVRTAAVLNPFLLRVPRAAELCRRVP